MSCVVPVVDYEPPVLRTASERVHLLRPRTPGSGRPRPAPPPATSAPLRAAGGFADAALRRVLEVIDRRRSLAQLRPLLAGGLVESLLPAVARHDGTGAACLRRLRVQPVGADGSAAEVAATYSRDDRVHAIACRVEQVLTPTGLRWQVVALHIG
ncbi:Rv3235 family protein [Mycobacterium sp. EPa45]|uniref:Rv3235 family protein n=1 Tax=Mycobacterium sp. EPa45 TaxID=1545728 RepID=UPI000AA802AD|nr:Rv3235 family protein [Mycobacterium sp. EPa45]